MTTRISTPDEIRAVRALPIGASVVVMGYAFGRDGEVSAEFAGNSDLRNVFVRIEGKPFRRIVNIVSVRPE